MGGNCSSRGEGAAACAVGSNKSEMNQKAHDTQYSKLVLKPVIQSLEGLTCRHGFLTWVVLPIFGALTAFVPFLQPSCETGFRDITLVFVALYEVHHIYSEISAWRGTLELVAQPEKTVMRHLGVLKRRRFLFWLGIIESLDLYTDVTFPFVARACDAHLTARWQETWQSVPLLGETMISLLETVRFWGFGLIVVSINVFVSGILGLMQMCRVKIGDDDGEERIGGENFFDLARSAETAMLPSVAMLSEEIARERMYKYDQTKDATVAMKLRQDIAYGHTTKGAAFEAELADRAAEEKVKKAAKAHYVVLMFVKVLVGNCMMLWLNASFYAVTFEITGQEAKIKIAVSMIASAIQALIRSKIITQKLGSLGAAPIGLAMSLIALGMIAWSGAKVYYAYHCDSHMWNLSSGCVKDTVVQQLSSG